ncbi:hypothetical protein Tco_0638313 [Tanacetum coccineum]
MDEHQPAPSSFTQPRPASYINDYEENQATYVKPPSHSDYVPTRPASHVEDQQRDLVGNDVPGEKSPPSFPQPRPASDINDYEEFKASYVKPPSYSDYVPTRPVSDKVRDLMVDEKPPTFGAVRPPNDSSDNKDSFDEKHTRPLSYRL